MSNIIEIKNLTKSFENFKAIENVNLSVRSGSIFGLLGPNGAGKTTTIKTMTGRLTFSSGEISILGLDVRKDLKGIHQQIGVVSESQNLYENLTVWENIDFFRELYNVEKKNTDNIIETLSLLDKRNEKVSNLSKGLKQRVLLARSILHSPKLLFLDEPTSGIDPSSSFEVHDFILRMKELGTTIFLTSHDMEEVDSLCDEVAFIDRGKIVASGSPKYLKKKFGTNEVEVSYLDREGKEAVQCFNMDDGDVFEKISNMNLKDRILSIHTKEATMKDVFLSVIKNDKGVSR
ncbi:hypothetical protein BIY24_14545 [Halobacteriovorax marinus]|uniref:ABC transport system, ATP-binding protein n=1 Tax=Halobacteriovorax marinus (strain ATCC BAA-682 / DSM 15412 / SJ) TaxID=862908 RepID=E1WZD9_HALMS|nr:ABC transporter ATP-binding protein [Halobacteriovorax marinus]ATH09117.1 hypothetical protein BIY24_14545 [Halobacteriovorax marinus]CBW27827.1 ABC transport system, ATP-binding protein [Halobacteriovorax marinus SJ]